MPAVEGTSLVNFCHGKPSKKVAGVLYKFLGGANPAPNRLTTDWELARLADFKKLTSSPAAQGPIATTPMNVRQVPADVPIPSLGRPHVPMIFNVNTLRDNCSPESHQKYENESSWMPVGGLAGSLVPGGEIIPWQLDNRVRNPPCAVCKQPHENIPKRPADYQCSQCAQVLCTQCVTPGRCTACHPHEDNTVRIVCSECWKTNT